MTPYPTTTPVPVDLVKLERLAKAATRGPWHHYNEVFRPRFSQRRVNEVKRRDGRPVICWGGFDGLPDATARKATANAAFIAAANPATILAMIERDRALTARIAELEGVRDALLGAGGAQPKTGMARFSSWNLDKLNAAFDLAVRAATPESHHD